MHLHLHDHGKVFMLAKKRDIEPEVLRQAADLGVTTSSLFDATAIDIALTWRLHVEITCGDANARCQAT